MKRYYLTDEEAGLILTRRKAGRGRRPTDEEAYEALLSEYSKADLADIVGISRQAISRWITVPAKYTAVISKATGIPRHHLRPSIFD